MVRSVGSQRTALVAMLLAVEVMLVGLMYFALRGSAAGSAIASGGGFHSADMSAKAFPAIAAGPAPHVLIDDPGSGVYVTASTDGLVHVQDETHVHGFVWGDS